MGGAPRAWSTMGAMAVADEGQGDDVVNGVGDEVVTDWVALSGFPRTLASRYAPVGSVARLVAGRPEKDAKGKPVMLRGAKAFAQGLEAALIAGYREAGEPADGAGLEALLGGVLAAAEAKLDGVDWCLRRGSELDLGLRVYATRGVTRLVLDLRGPVGAWAEREPPVLPKGPKAAGSARAAASGKAAASAKRTGSAAGATPETARAVVAIPPAGAFWRSPLWGPADGAEGGGVATPVFGNALGFEPDGRLVVCVRTPKPGSTAGYAFVEVDAAGAVSSSELPSREALRAEDPQVMTSALLPALYPGPDELVRATHFERNTGMRERLVVAGQVSVDRALNGQLRCLGRLGPWFARVVTQPRLQLVLVQCANGKRARLDLVAPAGAAPGAGVTGNVLDAAAAGDLLRLLVYANQTRVIERRRVTATPAPAQVLELVTALPAGAEDAAVALLPGCDAVIVLDAQALRMVTGGVTQALVAFRPEVAAAGLEPWGVPEVHAAAGGRFAASFHLGPSRAGGREGASLRGVVAFDAAGKVLHALGLDAAGALRGLVTDEVVTPPGHRFLGATLGPSGELAVLLAAEADQAVAIYRTEAAPT